MTSSTPIPAIVKTRSLAVLWLAFAATASAQAQTTPVLDTFTAATTAMTPRDVALKVVVREWSNDTARADVLAALGNEAEARAALAALRTVGYVWHGGSAIGYALKYAYRSKTDQGERVTFVTDRPVGTDGLQPWVAQGASGPSTLPYSVIELELGGPSAGSGTLSLAADVKLDTTAAVVSLAAKPGTPPVLMNAKLEPKPYWASGH